MKKSVFLSLCLPLFLFTSPALAYDLGGIALGGKEVDVKKAMPATHCKPLEWKSDAADRRCDDSRAPVGGVETRTTVFLNNCYGNYGTTNAREMLATLTRAS